MPSVQLTPRLRAEYSRIFNNCVIRADRTSQIEATIKSIDKNRKRYDRVEVSLGVPWYVVGIVHSMEASLDFTTHLHNGDSLKKRTVQVPAGRPKVGEPPFEWELSAADALTLKKLNADTDWSLAGTLYCFESYNGWGYRLFHPEVLSPYLWSFSNQYNRGKYIADGTWSQTAISKQCGAAVILRRMAEKSMIEFPDQALPQEEFQPLVVTHSNHKSRDPEIVAQVLALQRWLNDFNGIFVKIDGIPGNRTSDAYKKVTGHFLPGDPRA
jgi:lysozyme family protein